MKRPANNDQPRRLRHPSKPQMPARFPLTFLMTGESTDWEWMEYVPGKDTGVIRGLRKPHAQPDDLLICRLENGNKAIFRFVETAPIEEFPDQFIGVVECVEHS